MFRKIIFWAHLIAGLVAGISIGVMCFTGTALAFEKQLIAWAERDVRRVEPPAASAPRLTLDELQRKLRETQPEARPMSIVLQNDPRAAVAFTSGGRGGGGAYYANPYTGEIRPAPATAMSGFMQTMNAWHRTLAFTGEQSRPRGKLVNGVCNIAFCMLAISGLYLWLPRQWSWRALRPVVWFRQNSSGKARDFNWHNVIGLWSAPVLIVLTLTAIPISFQWGGRVIAALTGTPAGATTGGPAGGGGPGGGPGGAPVEVPTPAAGAKRLSPDDLFALVQKETPQWESITIRTGGGGGRGGAGGSGEARPAAPAAQAVTFAIRAGDSWPRTATTTLALDPFTGAVLRRTGYADLPAAQQVRSWTRFLHTGEALGLGGQWIAGLACLGGCFLVYTGFALAWRRFFSRSATPSGGDISS